ncbi:MarR family transcriptional regulator [Lichenihabitans sp. Uapishka_5]|uniref:MarR family winged helix-turn-helix transcriptional regulator n=1 Tax=Lichenihabitans sp. Uapishka_5 TaxID=3037302 RepID=UPI0029E82593|nr:MarR family transcriptional regulator [Lichenihabitans sp. Uapishka_5]MDX7949652.1 MarR family transcriptional regulator [Lichenihabitans sp. Uapishka_5]
MVHDSPTLGFLLNDVARLLQKRFEQRARSLGLTRAQWQVLVYLAPNEGIHQGGLAELLDIEPITLVRILDKLEARKLVERRRHATDRRLWLLYLQEGAHPLLKILRAYGDATRAEMLVGIDEDAQQQLFDRLGGMKSNLLKALILPVEDDREARYG